MTAFTINFNAIVQMTDEHFAQLCRANPDVKFERTTRGELVIVAPTGGETGSYNSELNADFVIWNRHAKLGIVFDSSTCFRLPHQALRSPDVAWIKQDRWDALTPEQKQKFPPISPDFVLELMSPSDDLSDAQAKMREYMENGVTLGWLLNRKHRTVEIYRPNQPLESLEAPVTLSDEAVLPRLVLNLRSLW
ncbi:MAG: Uma2 family endonuclease [Stenomitos rutilans HA7619-LM2]|jgi:Uma2 family endonuclease|nr:Uma2 family endonuclease [Stenomitos rutilans HA7619-LM2]